MFSACKPAERSLDPTLEVIQVLATTHGSEALAAGGASVVGVCEASQKSGQPFTASLVRLDGEKFHQFDIQDQQRASAVRDQLSAIANGRLRADRIKRKERKRKPSAVGPTRAGPRVLLALQPC